MKQHCDHVELKISHTVYTIRLWSSPLLFLTTVRVLLSPPWGGEVKDSVQCSSWAHWKTRSGLPISVNWTFFARCYGWNRTGENRSKLGDFAPTRSVWPKKSGKRRRSLPIILARLVRPMNALQLCRWQFSHKETLLQTFFKRSAILHRKRPFCVFEPPLGA